MFWLPFTVNNRIRPSKLSIIWKFLGWMLNAYCFKIWDASQTSLSGVYYIIQSDDSYYQYLFIIHLVLRRIKVASFYQSFFFNL